MWLFIYSTTPKRVKPLQNHSKRVNFHCFKELMEDTCPLFNSLKECNFTRHSSTVSRSWMQDTCPLFNSLKECNLARHSSTALRSQMQDTCPLLTSLKESISLFRYFKELNGGHLPSIQVLERVEFHSSTVSRSSMQDTCINSTPWTNFTLLQWFALFLESFSKSKPTFQSFCSGFTKFHSFAHLSFHFFFTFRDFFFGGNFTKSFQVTFTLEVKFTFWE